MRVCKLLFTVSFLFVAAFVLHAQSGLQQVSLDGAWQFRQTSGDAHPGTADWHAATVPGVVQTDLLANHLIPDPFYRDDESQLQWIGLAGWEYQRSFTILPEQIHRRHVELVFHGLDTFAKVYVNDHLVLSADNMFRSWRVDVRSQLHVGNNQIRIAFASPILAALPEVKAEKYPLPASDLSQWDKPFGVATQNYTRKAPYNYGWDWGPRFLTIGIWQPVELQFWDEARIDSVYVRQRDVAAASANLSVEADILASGPRRVSVALTQGRWWPQGKADSAAVTGKQQHVFQQVWLHEGENHIVFPVNIQHPALWYPNGYGAQNLYRFQVLVKDGKRAVDMREVHTGLRSVVLQRINDKWGRSFTFVVNGIPIFAKGADVIPLDSFPTRVTEEQMTTLLASAREANMNMLRVWGGGYYETDRFYELCDQMGLMVWQEFMFSDAMYPHNAAFLASVHQEAIDQVRRLRNYASIVLWCGNNEVEESWPAWHKTFVATLPKDVEQNIWGGYMHLFSGILSQVVARYAPGSAYWPSSPSNDFAAAEGNDQYGDAHYWAVWHGRAPFAAYADQYPRFMSEYGFQSFPSMATIDSFTLPEDRALLSKVMLAHQKNKEGNQIIKTYMQREFPDPKDFPAFVYVSQVLQAEGVKFGAEHLRRNRPHVMGSLYWQLNDCWPVASWASMDYYNRWKALQYYAKRFYNDVLVSPHVRNGQVAIAVVSDRVQPFDATVHAQVMDFSGKVLVDKQWPVHVAPLSAQEIWREAQAQLLQGLDPSRVFLHTEIVANGATLSSNTLYFLPFKDLHLPAAQLQIQWTQVQGAPAVTLRSTTLARDVNLDFGALDVQPADNFFDLLPGQSKTIVLQTKVSLSALQSALHGMSLTDAFAPAAPASSEKALR